MLLILAFDSSESDKWNLLKSQYRSIQVRQCSASGASRRTLLLSSCGIRWNHQIPWITRLCFSSFFYESIKPKDEVFKVSCVKFDACKALIIVWSVGVIKTYLKLCVFTEKHRSFYNHVTQIICLMFYKLKSLEVLRSCRLPHHETVLSTTTTKKHKNK